MGQELSGGGSGRGYSGERGRLGVGGGLVRREGNIVGVGWGRVGRGGSRGSSRGD